MISRIMSGCLSVIATRVIWWRLMTVLYSPKKCYFCQLLYWGLLKIFFNTYAALKFYHTKATLLCQTKVIVRNKADTHCTIVASWCLSHLSCEVEWWWLCWWINFVVWAVSSFSMISINSIVIDFLMFSSFDKLALHFIVTLKFGLAYCPPMNLAVQCLKLGILRFLSLVIRMLIKGLLEYEQSSSLFFIAWFLSRMNMYVLWYQKKKVVSVDCA